MTTTSLSPKQLITDRIVAIVFMCLGVLFEIIWFVPSLMSFMIGDGGYTPAIEAGIYIMILGPIVALVGLTVTTIVLLVLKRRAMITGILTLVAPVLIVLLGVGLAFSGK